jgi:hypothetical protein
VGLCRRVCGCGCLRVCGCVCGVCEGVYVGVYVGVRVDVCVSKFQVPSLCLSKRRTRTGDLLTSLHVASPILNTKL